MTFGGFKSENQLHDDFHSMRISIASRTLNQSVIYNQSVPIYASDVNY